MESLRVSVIFGDTVEHGLVVEVLLPIRVLVLVLVTAMLAEEVPVAVWDLVRAAERERVGDPVGVFDCVIDLVPLEEPVDVLEEVIELVPVLVPRRVLVASSDLENDGDADEVLVPLPVRVPHALPVEVLDCAVVLEIVGLALDVLV